MENLNRNQTISRNITWHSHEELVTTPSLETIWIDKFFQALSFAKPFLTEMSKYLPSRTLEQNCHKTHLVLDEPF